MKITFSTTPRKSEDIRYSKEQADFLLACAKHRGFYGFNPLSWLYAEMGIIIFMLDRGHIGALRFCFRDRDLTFWFLKGK